MATTTATQTLIIGGGIVGATLALKLAQQQQKVTLIDARPELSEAQWQDRLKQRDARVFALSIASIELLKEVGAWQLIAQSGRKADYTLKKPGAISSNKLSKSEFLVTNLFILLSS